MFVKIKFTFVMVFSLIIIAPLQAAVILSVWDGEGDGDSWSDAQNWDPDIVPDNSLTQTFEVTIDSSAVGLERVKVGLTQNRTIDKLDLNGQVLLGPKEFFRMILSVQSKFTNHGLWITMGEGLTIRDGELENLNGASIMAEGQIIAHNCDVTNAGIIMVTPQSSFQVYDQLHNMGKIIIYGGLCTGDDVLNNDTSGVITGYGTVYGAAPLVNRGKIHAFGGSLTLGTEGYVSNLGVLSNAPGSTLHVTILDIPGNDTMSFGCYVSNSGRIEVCSGGGVAFDPNMINESDAEIQMKGGSFNAQKITQSMNATFTGQGNITGTLHLPSNSQIRLTGPTSIFGDVDIQADATLEISDGINLVTGLTTNQGTIHMKGGYLIPQGGFINSGDIIWEPGIYVNLADYNLDGQINLKDFSYFGNSWLWQSAWR